MDKLVRMFSLSRDTAGEYLKHIRGLLSRISGRRPFFIPSYSEVYYDGKRSFCDSKVSLETALLKLCIQYCAFNIVHSVLHIQYCTSKTAVNTFCISGPSLRLSIHHSALHHQSYL